MVEYYGRFENIKGGNVMSDTTDFSGQQGGSNDKGLHLVIFILIAFVLFNEIGLEWGYRN